MSDAVDRELSGLSADTDTDVDPVGPYVQDPVQHLLVLVAYEVMVVDQPGFLFGRYMEPPLL